MQHHEYMCEVLPDGRLPIAPAIAGKLAPGQRIRVRIEQIPDTPKAAERGELGASPIPYGRQSLSEQDVAAVCSVLRSDFLTQGPQVPAFEQAAARYCGAHHAVAVNSGTSALHIACLSLGLEPGDTLWTSPITFVASANCGLYCGARVDFVDIDPQTGNMSLSALKVKLQQAETENRRPKIVIPVHLGGQPCDMQAIRALSEQYRFKIIEDASHALGARYQHQPVGSCRYSDITVFSFHPVKIITTGEGGMALTHDAALAQKMARLRSHGITRDAAQMTRMPDGPWYYEQIELGWNYRMTDLQAALGLSQLPRLDEFVARRRQLAQRYDTALAGLPLTRPWQHPDGLSAWHLYVIRLKREALRVTHRQVFEALRAQGIGVNLHYIPIHTQPYYRRQGFAPGMFPEAEAYYQEAITLPLFPDLTEGQQDIVVEAVKSVLF